ncbi:MAG: DUF4252 domain-containing protein [Chlorobi bacterium]|nr:DUF4252 domain-containing protein [Chlorobiota bacterium]
MKTLKLIIAAIFVSTVSVLAQDSPSDKLFSSLDGKDGITILSFSKQMLDFVNMDIDNSNITGELDKIKILIYNSPDTQTSFNLRKTALSALSGKYKKIKPDDIDKEADDDVDIMILKKGKKIKECHIIIENNDEPEGSGLMVSFYGNFDVKDLKNLTDKAEKYN